MATQTRKVGPLSTRATVGSIDAKKRTVDVVWSTGAAVLRSSWYNGPFWEELSMDPAHVRMDRLRGGAPFLADHNARNVADTLGVIESASVDGKQGIATVRFAAEGIDPRADLVFAKIRDGVITAVSVGYRIHKIEKVGETDGVPTMRATDWEPHEISAVAVPADAAAGFRDADLNEVLIVNADQRSNTKMEPKIPPGAATPPAVDPEAQRAAEKTIRDAAIVAERARAVSIRAAVQAARLPEAEAERMINEGITVDAARALVIESLARGSDAIKTEGQARASTPITGGDTANEKFMRGAISALLMTTVPALVREAKAKGVAGFDKVDEDHGLRGMRPSDFARESLERSGVSTRGMDRETLAKRAFTMSQRDGGPYAGTADFPILLENAIGKMLMGAYATTPDTWSRVCKIDSVTDFRASPRYRTGSLSVLDSLNENGEFLNKGIPDGAKLQISTATKGNIIAISRQLLINDDMSALSDLATKLGRAAKLSIEVDFYILLAQNGGLGPTVGANPFFHTSNGNVNATGSAITVAGLDADRVVMGSQKDKDNNEYLDLRPETLLIPLGLGGQARVLNQSQYDPDAANKLQLPNKVVGLFRDIVDTPRLSGTRRYLFANPSVAAAFVVAFLQGQQSPVLDSEVGWRVDGTELKVRFDYLVQAFDVKGALTNAGV